MGVTSCSDERKRRKCTQAGAVSTGGLSTGNTRRGLHARTVTWVRLVVWLLSPVCGFWRDGAEFYRVTDIYASYLEVGRVGGSYSQVVSNQ